MNKKIYCNTCGLATNHEIKASHESTYEEHLSEIGGALYQEEYVYQFLICCGCETATLEEQYHCSGMYTPNGDDRWAVNHHPERRNTSERKFKKFLHIDKRLNKAYREVILSYKQGLTIVTAMGVRAVLEGICVVEGIDDKKAWGLDKKLKFLGDELSIPASIITSLRSLKFLGDAAAHRLDSADSSDLSSAIDLVEALLTHLYEAKFELHKNCLLYTSPSPRD